MQAQMKESMAALKDDPEVGPLIQELETAGPSAMGKCVLPPPYFWIPLLCSAEATQPTIAQGVASVATSAACGVCGTSER